MKLEKFEEIKKKIERLQRELKDLDFASQSVWRGMKISIPQGHVNISLVLQENEAGRKTLYDIIASVDDKKRRLRDKIRGELDKLGD
jgi:vacuolar-type H+-ATPase subunit I/STV1